MISYQNTADNALVSAHERTSSNDGYKALRWLSIFALCFALLVIMKGAYTRLVDAGLGCPDWPGCYGMLAVPNEAHEIAAAEAAYPDSPVESAKGWPEMIHRYIAGSLGLMIVAISILALRQARPGFVGGKPNISLHALGLLGLVILQGLFGMWTVTLKLWPQVVTAHLLGGFATLAVLALLVCRLWIGAQVASRRQFSRSQWLKPFTGLAIVLLIGQIALGGWMSSNYAALACVDLPTCHGSYWPDMDFQRGFDVSQHIGPNYLGGMMDNSARVAIHFTHRLGAVVVSIVLIALVIGLLRSGQPLLRRLAVIAGTLLLLQITLGVVNVLAHVPLWSAVLHNAIAAVLLVSLAVVRYVQQMLHLPTREKL